MADYRRCYMPGGSFFFTVVTERRVAILGNDLARDLLRAAFRDCRQRWPFRVDALVMLPDHLHAIWTLPPDDANYSKRWGAIKKHFTRGCHMPYFLRNLVGQGCANEPSDLAAVGTALHGIISKYSTKSPPAYPRFDQFTRQMDDAIRWFQRDIANLFPDGIVGNKTWRSMEAELSNKPYSPSGSEATAADLKASEERKNKNLRWAQLAVQYVRVQLKYGAGNKRWDLINSLGYSGVCTVYNRVAEMMEDSYNVRESTLRIGRHAIAQGCGNCEEHAAAAIVYLKTRSVRPIEMMYRTNYDHVFVVIGRPVKTKASEPTTWGSEPAICDPYDGRAYSADEIKQKMLGGGQIAPKVMARWSE